MYHTTGFSRDQITDLCVLIRPFDPKPRHRLGRKQKLGLFNKVCIVLTYLRRNRRQVELAEQYQVDQSTISLIIITYTPVIAQALTGYTPTVDDLTPAEQLIIDGTLLPSWSWADHKEDYSGKHHTTGLNVQVACDLNGTLAWISDPLPGRIHDATALRQSGLLDTNSTVQHIGDKGYIGCNMITPIRKPPGQPLTKTQHEYNTQISSIRAKIERTIANLKTWRILHTDYRRPHHTHPQTITTILTLEFYLINNS